VGFVGGETGYCSETCVTGGVGGTGEGSVGVGKAVDIKEEVKIKVEDPLEITEKFSIKFEDPLETEEEVGVKFEAVYIEEEMPDTTTCPAIKTEHEVRLWGVS
jgi:hypothetical protein